MRRSLDLIYAASGGLAALSILAICLLVSAQVGLNILARLGGPEMSYTIPSYADFAGFMLAGASFLGIPYAFRHGTHIRVSLVTSRLGTGPSWALEVLSLAVATMAMGYASWFAFGLVEESLYYGDMSTGMIAVPLWIPQCVMAAGLVVTTLAMADRLVESIRARAPILTDEGAE